MGKEVYYKSEVMETVNQTLIDEISNIVYGVSEEWKGELYTPSDKLMVIKGMLLLVSGIDEDLKDEKEDA